MPASSRFDPSRTLILIVDDDRTVRALLRRFLQGEGYQVAEAQDGLKAVEILQQLTVDLVILDVIMPGLDGKGVCLWMRDQFPEPPPALIMTAMDYDLEVDQFFEAGAVDYVHKPLKWPVLRNRIKYILKARHSTRQLGLLTQKYGMILDAVDNGISGFDANGRITYVNQAAQLMLGYSAREILGRNCQMVFRIARAGSVSFRENCAPFLHAGRKDLSVHFDEVRMERKDGTTFLAELRSKPVIQEGRLTGGVLVFLDITERQEAAQIIRHMANHDNLTNLPNRNYLEQRLPQAVSLARRQERLLFLLFIDLDRFKPINDRYGHAVGDAVLIEVAQRLSSAMRASDSVCRLGGDEFVILLESAATLHGAIMVAERAIDLLNQPITVNGQTCSIGASIGIAVCPDDSAEADELMRHADQAMYAAKKKGRNCWHLYGDRVGADQARAAKAAEPSRE